MILFKKYRNNFFSLIGGALYALGFPLFNGSSIVIAPIVGFTLLNWVLDQENSLKKKMYLALNYSLGFYLMGFYWIPHLLKEFGGLFFPLNFLLGLLFSLVIIPHVYFFVWIKTKINSLIVLSLIYVALEQLIPQQFPAHLGHSFLFLTPAIKLVFAPLAGALFYSFFACFLSLTIVRHIQLRQKPIFNYSIIALIILAHLPGNFLNSQTEKKESNKLNIRLVQPNIGNFIKLDSEKGGALSIRSVFESYYYLSTNNIVTPRDLIIWPETAYPSLFFSDTIKNDPNYQLPPLLKEVINKTQAELFIGGYDSNSNFNSSSYQSDYNTAFHFGKLGQLKDVYHKMKLIPFGEGLPFGPLNPLLSKIITNISYFSEGTQYTGFKTENNIPFVAVICYEILFPDFVAKMLNKQQDQNKQESQFLINLTNDSWYGDTAEPHQHLFLSKWRAIEFNLPIIRSTNTGITTVIYPDGSETERLSVGEKTYLDLDLTFSKREKTLYQKLGFFSLIIFVSILCLIELALKRKSFFQQIMKPNKT
ncbi:MAG: apolipoprotein N-acyltransferase [Bacteriovoracaceae bacterium]|nr:apolipoprotein N-acyltransferase [Bacteriovoracaceae bacterium]